MNDTILKVVFQKDDKGVYIKPATGTDSCLLNQFIDKSANKYVTITLKTSNKAKTYSQIKTCWGLFELIVNQYRLIDIITTKEIIYDDMLEMFAEKTHGTVNPEKEHPITLSKMDCRQLSLFIQNVINFIVECFDLNKQGMIDLKLLFEDYQNYMSSQEKDWNDYDENGDLLSVDEWDEKHQLSFASGLGGELDKAHIVSRGADERYRDCVWNLMKLTREEHQKQHEIGWYRFCELYPHLKGRVERAERLSGHNLLKNTESKQNNEYKTIKSYNTNECWDKRDSVQYSKNNYQIGV